MTQKIKSKNNVKYKCLYCDERYTRIDLVDHINENHEDEIPEGYSALRVVFNYINRKPMDYNGKCTECGGPTRWDENKARYDRQCSKQACKDSYLKKFEENMQRKHGTKRISQSEEGQKKMLAGRKISGKYKFRDGVEKDYCGSYELKALEFMDKVMHINSWDIFCPGPVLEYKYTDGIHKYITDFYYQPYNLIIEVKYGGDNPNKRNMPDYRAKQIAKEKFIVNNTNYNYIRLTNNDLSQLLAVFMDLKMQLVDNTGNRVIHINENTSTPIYEFMNALNSGKIPGLRDADAYIINYQTNKVFSDDKLGFTDNLSLTNIIGMDDDNNLNRIDKKDIKNAKVYRLNKSVKEVSDILSNYIGKEVSCMSIYEAVTGNSYFSSNQIKYEYTEVETADDYSNKLINSIKEYYTRDTKSEIEKLIRSINEVVNNG